MLTDQRPVMDREVSLQQPSESQNAFGETTITYTTVETVPCAFAALSGGERFVADRLAAFAFVKFTIRYRTDVNAKWRAVFETKTYNIKDVAELGRRQWLELTALAVDQ